MDWHGLIRFLKIILKNNRIHVIDKTEARHSALQFKKGDLGFLTTLRTEALLVVTSLDHTHTAVLACAPV